MSRVYTGIGSRETPGPMLEKIIDISAKLAENGWILRSGAADGADAAFEYGCDIYDGDKQIYLPWKGFNGSNSNLYLDFKNDKAGIQKKAFEIAASIHPAWDKLTDGGRKLHTRNVFQILGWDLESPTGIVIAWTKKGQAVGGTRTALVLAQQHNIPIINLCTDTIDWSILK